ncbi:MAG: hypothetical protein WHT06_11975 [Desulfobacterales bacterium]
MSVLRLLVFVLAAAAAGACAGLPPPRTLPEAAPAAEAAWQALRFRFTWPPGLDPAWHLDSLFADRLVRPILEEEGPAIPLWRFHRRAVRDAAGHQLSFLFRADSATARRVRHAAVSHPLVARARQAGCLAEIVAEEGAGPAPLSDTSDPSWPPALREAWPHYIAGVSRMWLELVRAFAPPADPPGDGEAFETLENGFRETERRIRALWRTQGLHAFLHHLNALFGYEPVAIGEERRLRF